MLRPPEACRESMERARFYRSESGRGIGGAAFWIRNARRETREILRALRAARRGEGALMARWGVAS
jgi:hypothetical protein